MEVTIRIKLNQGYCVIARESGQSSATSAAPHRSAAEYWIVRVRGR
jgi:hypothetical protein